jgi:hypothetical protein
MKKTIMGIALAAIVAFPTSSFASEKGAPQSPAPTWRTEGKFACHFAKHLQINQKKEQELLQLAEKYAPERTNDLRQAIEKRRSLLKEMQALNPKEKHEKMLKEREAKLDALLDQLTSGKITKEQFKQKLKEHEKQRFKQWKNKHLAAAKENREFHQRFREALRTKNEAEMAKLFPQFIQHLQAENQRLEKLIENMKQS